MRRVLAFAMAGVMLASCGVSSSASSDLKSAADVKAALIDAGLKCDGKPVPFDADNSMDIGPDPVEELECTIKGADITVTVWKSDEDRLAAMVAALAIVCSFDDSSFDYIAAGPWAIASAGSGSKDKAAMVDVAKALDEPTKTKECKDDGKDSSDSVPSGPSTEPVDESTTTAAEAPSAGSSKDDPLSIGQQGTVGDYTVRITSTDLDALDFVLKENSFNDPPENGRYVVIVFDATYEGSGEGTPDLDISMVLSGGDARQYNAYDCGASVGGDSMVTLEPGGTETIVDCFDVPPEALDGGAIFAKDSMSFDDDDRVYWSLD